VVACTALGPVWERLGLWGWWWWFPGREAEFSCPSRRPLGRVVPGEVVVTPSRVSRTRTEVLQGRGLEDSDVSSCLQVCG